MRRPRPPFLAGAVVTVACLLAAPAASAGDADALVAKGKALLEKRDWAGAKEAFLGAVAKDPKDVEARRGAAEALLQAGSPDEAVSQAYAGLDLVKDADPGLWLTAARAFLHKGETLPAGKETEIADSFADAKAKASEALKRDPSLSYAQVVLAKACRLTNDLDRAAQVLAGGLEKQPKSFELLMEKGLLALKKKEMDAAAAAFGAAAEADPASGEAQFQKGIAHAFAAQWDACYAAFVKASLLDPSNRKPLIYIARYAPQDCLKLFREIVKKEPKHVWAHAYLAYYLAAAKDEAGALTESKTAMALQGDNADLVAWHGQVLEALGRAEEARAWYRKAIEKGTTVKTAFDRLSTFAFAPPPTSTAKPDERQATFEFLAKRNPADALFWNNAGLLFRDTIKDYRKSLQNYLRAAELAPADQGIQNDTGLIYLYHGKSFGEDQHRALPFFQQTQRLVEEDGQAPEMGYRDTLENLAVYYMEVEKDPERALEFAEKRNDPGFYKGLDASIAQPSGRAAGVKTWAEQQLKK